MAEETKISWCNSTVNFWWGCTKVSPACTNCYAETWSKRVGDDIWGENRPRKIIASAESMLRKLNAKAGKSGERHLVFVNSMSDFFESDRPIQIPMVDHKGMLVIRTLSEMRKQAFELFDYCNNLTFLLLTKRPENIVEMWPEYIFNACLTGDCPHETKNECSQVFERDNVWIGTTVENQEYANRRIPELLKCRDLSPVLFLSCEPLLGEVDLRPVLWLEDQYFKLRTTGLKRGVDWVIAGGESGPNARPSHPAWFRDLRDQCGAARIPFHFKQWGDWLPIDHVTEDMKVFEESDIWRNGPSEDDLPMLTLRVGKDRAGRILDDVVHDAFPEVAQ